MRVARWECSGGRGRAAAPTRETPDTAASRRPTGGWPGVRSHVATGSELRRYEIRETLGEGGFATVYRVWDPLLGREVALKVLQVYRHAPADIRARFLAEARALAQLRHQNIVDVYDVGEEHDCPYFTMECIDGQTLAELTPPDGLDPALALEILAQLAAAVDYLHERGLVHRDIKPANIMRDLQGRVVLMDFGVARMLDSAGQTRTGAVLGTPQTMAPEQVRGERVGPAADIYSLGVIAYYLLAGRPPFVGDATRVSFGHVHEPPPPLEQLRPGLPQHLYAAVAAALAKDTAGRPQTAGHFAAALAGTETLPPPVASPPTPLAPTVIVAPQRPARHRSPLVLVGAIAAIALAGAAATAFLVDRRDDAAAPTPATPETASRAIQQTAVPVSLTQTPPVQTPAAAQPAIPALLAPGERLSLNISDSADLDPRFVSCGGVEARVQSVLRIAEIERDRTVPDRVRVFYTRTTPAVVGVQCSVPYTPDAGTLDILLETLKQDGGDDVLVAVNAVSGTGLSVEGTSQLYGREISGSWVFERVDLAGRELRLVQRLENETVLHRIKLLPR